LSSTLLCHLRCSTLAVPDHNPRSGRRLSQLDAAVQRRCRLRPVTRSRVRRSQSPELPDSTERRSYRVRSGRPCMFRQRAIGQVSYHVAPSNRPHPIVDAAAGAAAARTRRDRDGQTRGAAGVAHPPGTEGARPRRDPHQVRGRLRRAARSYRDRGQRTPCPRSADVGPAGVLAGRCGLTDRFTSARPPAGLPRQPQPAHAMKGPSAARCRPPRLSGSGNPPIGAACRG